MTMTIKNFVSSDQILPTNEGQKTLILMELSQMSLGDPPTPCHSKKLRLSKTLLSQLVRVPPPSCLLGILRH